MKLAKMSLVAAMLLGANLYAIDNVKVNGDARLYYHTDDSETATGDGGLFAQDSSAGNAALNIGLTADLSEGVSAGVKLTGISTLGLEGNLVSQVWEGGTGPGFTQSDYWFSEAWMAGTAGKTTAKVGRQALDTPLAFTETWSIVENTFDSAVLINQDIADTTLVGAWIGQHNSGGAGIGAVVALPDQLNGDSRYSTFAKKGAYTVGVINNSFKPLTAQAWYYDMPSYATAIWAQADLEMEGILVGAQYATQDLANDTVEFGANAGKDGNAYAVMLGYAMKDVATVKVAYSATDDELGAGQNAAGVQTKLYTEVWWNYGKVAATDTETILINAEATVAGYDLYIGYGMIDDKTVADTDLNELAITVSRSFGPLDTSIAYINTDETVAGVNGGYKTTNGAENMLQVYLTYNF